MSRTSIIIRSYSICGAISKISSSTLRCLGVPFIMISTSSCHLADASHVEIFFHDIDLNLVLVTVAAPSILLLLRDSESWDMLMTFLEIQCTFSFQLHRILWAITMKCTSHVVDQMCTCVRALVFKFTSKSIFYSSGNIMSRGTLRTPEKDDGTFENIIHGIHILLQIRAKKLHDLLKLKWADSKLSNVVSFRQKSFTTLSCLVK